MSVESILFGGKFDPQKGALKKNSELPVYVSFVWAKNKSTAKILLQAGFLKFAPDCADDYFAPKIWEAVEGMFCAAEGQFYTDAFTDGIVWNAEKGEPERVLTEPEMANEQEELPPAEKMTLVKNLDRPSRTASLVLFGPVQEITEKQYSLIVDLINDDESSFSRELAEAIAREPRVLELLPVRQVELLAHVRETARETAQWTDIKKIIVKWIDAPAAQREKNGAAINELQQRSTLLRYRIALGVISRSMDFDIDSVPVGIELRANSMLNDKNETDITDWLLIFSRTPGIYDFHPAAIIAMIKTAEDKISHYPGELRKYIDKCISDFDCVNPPQLVIDIASGFTSAPLPQKTEENKIDDQARQAVSGETEIPAVCPARAAELDRELDAAFASSASNEVEKQEAESVIDDRVSISDRESEIACALNDLVSGHTSIMKKEEAEGVVACTGHLIAHVIPLLITDIATTEYCLSPDFSDEEIHDVATTILDGWSDDAAVRQKIALDAIVEYRKSAQPEPIVIDPPAITAKPRKEPNPVTVVNNGGTALTWQQQLTIAALQGLCANPAYCGSYEDLPMMATWLASTVINAEAGND